MDVNITFMNSFFISIYGKKVKLFSISNSVQYLSVLFFQGMDIQCLLY
jgi:hypothetical protein